MQLQLPIQGLCLRDKPLVALRRPWELLSGGLDATVVRWDFNRLRPQQSWNLSAEAAASGGVGHCFACGSLFRLGVTTWPARQYACMRAGLL